MTEQRCQACESVILELDCQDCLRAGGAEELRDNIKLRRASPRKAEQCRKGHALTADNTRTRKRMRNELMTTYTECLTCKRAKEKRRRNSQEYIDTRKKKRRVYG